MYTGASRWPGITTADENACLNTKAHNNENTLFRTSKNSSLFGNILILLPSISY